MVHQCSQMPQGHDTPAANTSEQADDHPKETEECLACWTHQWDTASFQSTAPSPELQQEPQSWHGLAGRFWQLTVGLNVKQSTTSSVSTAGRDFATCVCREHPAHAGRAASPAGTSQPDESTRLAMPPRRASCKPLSQRAISTSTSMLPYTQKSHQSPSCLVTPCQSTGCYRPIASPVPSSWESQKAITERGISSCYRNIQQDTAWQLLMSVALNHKHFELFRYNGKLWEGERKRTG